MESKKSQVLTRNTEGYKTLVFSFESGTQGRGFFDRTFMNYGNNTLRSAIMTLLNCAKGVGCLSIPIGYANLGMIPACIILTLAAVNMCFTFYMINRVQLRNMDCTIYSQLVRAKLGKKSEKGFAILFIIYLIGSLIGYVLCAESFFMNSFGPMLAESILGVTPEYYNTNLNEPEILHFNKWLSLIMLFGGCVLLLPFGIPRIASNFVRFSYLLPLIT